MTGGDAALGGLASPRGGGGRALQGSRGREGSGLDASHAGQERERGDDREAAAEGAEQLQAVRPRSATANL